MVTCVSVKTHLVQNGQLIACLCGAGSGPGAPKRLPVSGLRNLCDLCQACYPGPRAEVLKVWVRTHGQGLQRSAKAHAGPQKLIQSA